MKVLVLGGTGAIGEHLIRLLAETQTHVVVTSRKKHISTENLRYIQGDAQDVFFLNEILKEKWDSIVDFMLYTTTDFEERIDKLLNSTKQYIFLSSARVYADEIGNITEESTRLLEVSKDKKFIATNEYSLAKARQEDIIKKSGRNNWTIIRPYITYSTNRLQLGVFEKEEWLYRVLNGRTIVFSNDLKNKFTTLTYGQDVSIGIKALVGNLNALGEVFQVTVNQSSTWGNILDIYLNVLEKKLGYRPKVYLSDKDKFLQLISSEYQLIYDRLFTRKFDNSKINQFVNVNSFTSLESGLAKCLNDFLKEPKFNNINWKLEALKDRQVNELTSLKEIKGLKPKIKYLYFRFIYKN